jgi:hypothetical protein
VREELESNAEMLRATSDSLMLAIAEVDARERQKRGVPPADPSFPVLARDVRVAAERVLALARIEEVKANETSTDPGATALPPIEAVSPMKELGGILAAWRDVEQRLNAAPPGTPEAESLLAEFERLRKRYADAMDAKRSASS